MKSEVIKVLKPDEELSLEELKSRVRLVKGRNLVGVLKTLERRGVVRLCTGGKEVKVRLLANAKGGDRISQA